MKFSSILLSGLLALSAAACRDKGGGGGNGADGPDAGTGGDTIFDLQSDDMAVGAPVNLLGVVVVAVDDYGDRSGGLYVMEPEGGPFSGVLVFLRDDAASGIRPGDLVDITGGVKDEFALSADDSGRTLTEVSAPDNGEIKVVKAGVGSVPDPAIVVPQELAADDEEAEKWEGVLIQFENVRLLNAPTQETSDKTIYEVEITGPYIIQSALAKFPEDMARDECARSVTGIGDYFFDYKIQPRKTEDIVMGGEDCLPLEADDTLCADGEDNDFDGFADCEDFGCLAATVACPSMAATVVDIQSGAIADGTRVRLDNVVVTAVDRVGANEVYIQDAGAPGPNKGVAVRLPGGVNAPAALVPGSVLDVEGTVDEFGTGAMGTRTQLSQPVLSGITTGAAPTPLAGNVALLADPGEPGEPFEGAFVKVENLEVVSDSLSGGRVSVTDGTTELILHPNFFSSMEPERLSDKVDAGDCLDLTGVMDYNSSANQRLLQPRGVADIVKLPVADCD